jgi:peptidoglycan-N-acetylglucosamine deacetylase
MMGHDHLPYYARQGEVVTAVGPVQWGHTTQLIELPISWSLDDFPHFEYVRMPAYLQQGLRRAGDVLENWVDDFRYMTQVAGWGVLTYTFHPQVIGRGHRMLMLERLIETLGELGATFARMDAVADEFSQRAPATP